MLDAAAGFWQEPLKIQSTCLCTFNTLFGRHNFCRLWFGMCLVFQVLD